MSSRLSAPSRLTCQSAPPPRQRYSAARDGLGLVGDLGEALAEGRAPVGEGLGQILAVGAVLEAAQADQLEPAAAEAELVIAAKLVIIFALLLVELAQPGRIGARRDLVGVEMIEAEGALEVEDRAVAEIAAQRGREARLLAADVEDLVADVEDGAVRPVDGLRADIGRSRSKACTDLFRRRGNDIVEALIEGISVAQGNADMGALAGRERGGKAGLALQAGMLDETENPGIVDIA